MKKLFVLQIAVLMLLLISGCAGTQDNGESTAPDVNLQVGYCRVNINPSQSIPLDGYGNVTTRYFTEIGDDITATAIAISDGLGNDVLLISTDLIRSNISINTAIQEQITKETGISADRIIITACHSHSAPNVTETYLPEVAKYASEFKTKVVEAAVNAVEDMKPAEMYIGSVETENLNFVKHYKYTDANGNLQYFGDNFGNRVINDTTTHATEVDPTMHLLKFTRDGASDVVIVNWRAHPHFTGASNKYVLSSDYVSTFRLALEQKTNANVVYFQGASGNVNSNTQLASEVRASDHKTFGNLLAEHAVDGLTNNMTKVESGQIKTIHIEYYGEINHTQDHLYEGAQAVANMWALTNSWASCRPLMTLYGIRSPYHANAIVANYNRTEKDGKLILNAISIGDDFALVTFPGELFDTISANMEKESPFASTMLLGYACDHIGYLPSTAGYEYTCYESDITRFVKGTGENVQAKYIEMLNELKNRN